MAQVKIAIIGAGSAQFSMDLVKDICVNQNLKGSTLALMDLSRERLDMIYLLAVRYLKETGNALNIEKTTNRRECLEGADFVINVALDYGHRRLQEGWEIAWKYGFRFGGSLHIVHDEAFWVNFYQLRLMESIYRDVREICPGAYYILVANPVLAGITYLSRTYGGSRIVGMCHGYGGVQGLCETMGLDFSKVSYEVSGVNHFIWLTQFFYNGENAFPLLEKWIVEESGAYIAGKGRRSIGESLKAIDLYRRFGVFPIGDTCTPGGGSWPWWYHSEEAEITYNEDPRGWYDEYFINNRTRTDQIKKTAQDMTKKVTGVFPAIPSSEPMVPLIEALACDIEHKVIVNVQNRGCCVRGVPEDFEVEIPALVSKRGIQGLQTTSLPSAILSYLVRDRVAPVEMELQAFIHHDKTLLLSLLMMDPWCRSEEQAVRLLDGVLNLPCNKEMKEYYT
jgi:alpha-galactosidase